MTYVYFLGRLRDHWLVKRGQSHSVKENNHELKLPIQADCSQVSVLGLRLSKTFAESIKIYELCCIWVVFIGLIPQRKVVIHFSLFFQIIFLSYHLPLP